MRVTILLRSLFIFIITIVIIISLSFHGNTIANELSKSNYISYLDFFQLYEDCFNGIDDDGDTLIDIQDVFDC
jgi:hypothetical protein